MTKKILLLSNVFICAVLAVAVLVTALPSSASAAVGMKVRPGLGGLYKTDQPLELMITIENNGPGFDGSIRVREDNQRPDGHRPDMARFIVNVKVPADAREQYRMMIPGEFAATMPVVELVSGDLVLAKSRVEGAALGGSRVTLALSEDIMGSGLEAWLSSKSSNLQVDLKYLSPGELPVSTVMLNAADVIMIDAAGSSSLSGDQARAVKEWVHLGGTLVQFGGVLSSEGGLFADSSPVNIYGPENGVPVLARRVLGQGQVFYCEAAPRELGSQAQAVWSSIFDVGMTPGENIRPIIRPSLLNLNSEDMLTMASSYIPALAGPPIPVLVLLWLVYVAVIGPLLYFLLRRADRRDWAWALVPAVALLAAGCFYLLAPANRLQNYLSQTLATVDIHSPELAEIRAGASFVVARGGNLTVQAKDDIYAVPAGQQGGGWDDKTPALVSQEGKRVSINFNSVPYGSLLKASAYGLQRDFGSIDGKLYLEGSNVKGELINKTGRNLRDSRLLLGGRVVKIGDFPAGGSAYIEETLDNWNGLVHPETLLFETGSRGQPGDPYFRERQILSGLNEPMSFDRPAGIEFLGWHDGAPGIFQVAGSRESKEDYGLVLVKQSVKMELAKGNLRLPAGFIIPRPGNADGKIEYSPNGIIMQGNTIKLVYDIGEAVAGNNFKIEALYFQKVQEQGTYQAEIYNLQLYKWEPLQDGGKEITSGELTQYVSDSKVMVRLTRLGGFHKAYQMWPGLAVEGVVS